MAGPSEPWPSKTASVCPAFFRLALDGVNDVEAPSAGSARSTGPDSAFTLAEAPCQATALLTDPKAIEPKVVELEDRARGFADAPDTGRIRIDRI